MKFVFREVEFEDPTMCEHLNLRLLQGTVCSDDGLSPCWAVFTGRSEPESPSGCTGSYVDCSPCGLRSTGELLS